MEIKTKKDIEIEAGTKTETNTEKERKDLEKERKELEKESVREKDIVIEGQGDRQKKKIDTEK